MREIMLEKAGRERSTWKRAAVITALIGGLALGTVYGCGVVYFWDKFLPGTTINHMDVSYRTVGEVEAQVADDVGKYQLIVDGRQGEETIRADEIDYRYVSTGEVRDFKKQQSSFQWPVLFFGHSDYVFSSSAVYSQEKLENAMENLTAFDETKMTAPEDARIDFNGVTYDLVREKEGTLLMADKAKEAIIQAVETGQTKVNLDQEGCYQNPSVRADSNQLLKTYERLNHFSSAKIEYDFGGEKLMLDGSTIHQWLSVDGDGYVSLNSDAVAGYVAELAAQYDTYGQVRYFETNDGSYVNVYGGTYGWKIDQAAETEQLISLIKDGRQLTREPIYAETAGTRENCDMGNTYIEIDLTRQHLWMYKDGVTIVESDFVSGDMSKPGRATPEGTFSLYYKKSPDVLKSDTPGDSYETPVTYWMPFNGGVGLHDAYWRDSFGGNIYQYNGSHGCINLPTQAAAQIYENIYAGYPIICYYRG